MRRPQTLFLLATIHFFGTALWPLPLAAQPIFFPGTGNYYERVDNIHTWTDAKAAAESLSWMGEPGHLVTILSAEEHDFIVEHLLISSGLLWIGATDQEAEGDWRWISGESFWLGNSQGSSPCGFFSAWDPADSEPNDHLGAQDWAALRGNGLWTDRQDTAIDNVGFIVEFDTARVTGFQDDFNRCDGPLRNGWSHAPNNLGPDLEIGSDKLTSVGTNGYAAIHRKLLSEDPVRIQATITETTGNDARSRFESLFLIRGHGTAGGDGYGISVHRTEADTQNSQVERFDSGRLSPRDQIFSPFQFDSELDVDLTIFPDGRIEGIITEDGDPNDGEQDIFEFAFPARVIASNGEHFTFQQGQIGPGGLPPTLDNLIVGPSGPVLALPKRVTAGGEAVTIPVGLDTGGHQVAGVAFSVDYDETCLALDPTDSDADGIPDAVTLNVPAGFEATVFMDPGDSDGEIDVILFSIPPTSMPGGELAAITFEAVCEPEIGSPIVAPVRFSADPRASFSDLDGQALSGATVDGSIEIVGGTRGDCNGDGSLGVSDLTSCGLEIFDGDGDFWLDVPGGSFPGSPVGCDSNADQTVDAGDLSCNARLIFNRPCEGPSQLALEGSGPILSLPRRLDVAADATVSVPISFQSAGLGISSLAFSLDLDTQQLALDDPSAIEIVGAPGFLSSVSFDPEDASGELDILLTDFAAQPTTLTDGVLMILELRAIDPEQAVQEGVAFAPRPGASFGDPLGRSIPGSTEMVSTPIFADGFESGDLSAWSE